MNVCPEHNVAWVWKEGGTSMKTGQPIPYTGFFKCPVYGCKNKPAKGWNPNGAQQAPPARQAVQGPGAPARTPAAPVDPSIEGKVCTLIIEAFISSTRTVQWFMENESWLFQYAMKHRMPSFEDALEERWEHVPPDEQ